MPGNCDTTALKYVKVVKVSKGRTRAQTTTRALPTVPEEAVADDGEDLMLAEEELAQLLDTTNGQAVDQAADGQDVHDTHVARSVRARAIASMALKGVVIDPTRIALHSGFSPRYVVNVAGLAKKVHDSSIVADIFNSLVDTAKANSDKTALDHHCPT
ncbi:hypothetical protein C8R44DRAFT_728765 [Mycena epipterygia]|nr:hypothetical protein C8R44DRAFT_728765 [Mycena epipterygia]